MLLNVSKAYLNMLFPNWVECMSSVFANYLITIFPTEQTLIVPIVPKE